MCVCPVFAQVLIRSWSAELMTGRFYFVVSFLENHEGEFLLGVQVGCRVFEVKSKPLRHSFQGCSPKIPLFLDANTKTLHSSRRTNGSHK